VSGHQSFQQTMLSRSHSHLPASARTLEKTIGTSPSVNWFLFIAAVVPLLLSPKAASVIQQKIGLQDYNRPVAGNWVPWPHCKPRARSSNLSRHKF
jgi:hypothetical protein